MSPIEILGSQLIGLQSDHAASRAEALDVRIALSGELFDGGVKRVHAVDAYQQEVRRARSRYDKFELWAHRQVRVFISYRRGDAPFAAHALYGQLARSV